MSSFLPNVVVTEALKALKVKSNVDEAALAQKTREGLKRLYEFQHPDGGRPDPSLGEPRARGPSSA